MYTPLTSRGERYRVVGYWFATGWWFAQPRDTFIPDHSSEFGNYCARAADDYEMGRTGALHSVPDLWREFQRDVIYAPPTEATRATADQCELAGLDPSGRFTP